MTNLVNVETGDVEADDALFDVSQHSSKAEVLDKVLHDGGSDVLQTTSHDVRRQVFQHQPHRRFVPQQCFVNGAEQQVTVEESSY